MLQNDTITAAQIAAGAVGSSEIADASITGADIQDASITAADLAPGAGLTAYRSPIQTITAAGALSLTHGLGGLPRVVMLSLVCQTADAGYAPGDEVIISAGPANDTNNGIGVWITSTTVEIRFGAAASLLRVVNKTTGANASIVNANWRLVVTACR